MPYKDHPEFLPPQETNAKIWRYMDLAKFLSIIDRRCLYFVRLDQLTNFDPFEGYYTNLNVQFGKARFEDMPQEWKENTGINTPEIFNKIIESNKRTREIVKYNREVTFVNSWHIKGYESAAMWKLYLSNHEGIAIPSTYERLIQALEDYQDFEIMIGKIKYIDYEREAIPMGNMLSPFIYKRKSFEHEDELRALIWTPQHGKNDLVNPMNNKFKDVVGLYVPVNLDTLIQRVYIAPSAPKWFFELIASLVRKYGLEVEVVQSDLASRPIY